MSGGANLPGAAHLVLAGGVVHLDPESATFQAMLHGWELQQRARFLNHEATIAPRLRLVRRFAEFTNEYLWQWQPTEAEAFLDHLRSRKPDFAFSTARGYQNALRMFCEYITDARYGWPGKCLDSFGQVPAQIFREWNSIVHTSDYEGPVLMPPAIARLVMDQVSRSPRSVVGRSDGTHWLFPRNLAGKAIGATPLARRLATHGIGVRAAKNTAVLSLASDLPAPVLSQILGVHINMAVHWVKCVKRDWASYVESRRHTAPRE